MVYLGTYTAYIPEKLQNVANKETIQDMSLQKRFSGQVKVQDCCVQADIP